MHLRTGWILPVLAGLCLSCSSDEAGDGKVVYEGTRQSVGGVSVKVPSDWSSQTPSSSMRVAQFTLPGKAGSGDGELAVFYFGEGNAGSVTANLERWKGQMKGDDPGTVTNRTVNGMPVTVLDVKGTYAVSMGPMVGGAPPAADYQMVAAIVESKTGAYYFKLTGPEPTIGAWRTTFASFVDSAEEG